MLTTVIVKITLQYKNMERHAYNIQHTTTRGGGESSITTRKAIMAAEIAIYRYRSNGLQFNCL